MNRYTILVLNDDEVFRSNIVTALQDEGFRVITAAGITQGIDRLHSERPQFAIIDLSSESHILEMLREIRQDTTLSPIVMIIGSNPSLDLKLQCLSAGAHEFVTRPIDAREIIARVKRFHLMIDEFRNLSLVTPAEARFYAPAASLDKDRSHGTVDLIMQPGDSFARIRPQYGIYRVENLIGSGGMGYVFKAYEEPLDRFVALKILSRKLSNSPEFVKRFRHEAKVLASLNHPGIAFIYSFGEEEGEHYFAMQWCPGGSLADLVRKKGRLDLLPSVQMILQCAQGLYAASRKGIVHRDVKPSNLLFDENQQIKIVDFGLASGEKESSRITQAQQFLGTPSFMAPEQAQSSTVDHRADIYSLGITFYYMIYGRYPFEASSVIEMLIKHASEAFPQFDSLRGAIPRTTYDIIAKMTQKNPQDRYQDYPLLIADLESLRNDLLRKSQWKIPKLDTLGTAPPLRSSNLFELLATLYAQSASGVLNVRWAGLRKKFFVRQRDIVLYESTQPDENIWNELVRRKILGPSSLPSKNEDLEKSINSFLLKQAFSIEEFKQAYRHVMKSALMQVFLWPDLSADFQYGTIAHDSLTSVRIAEVLLESARSQLSLNMIVEHLPAGALFHRTGQFDTILASLDLRPEESFIAYRVEGEETTLNTLQLLTGIPEERIQRLLYALDRMGAIQSRSQEEKRMFRKSELPPEMPARPSVPADEPRIEDTPTLAAKGVDGSMRMERQKSDKKVEVEHHQKVAEQFFRLAQEKYEELDYWKVTEFCKQAIRHNPMEARYFNLMALAYSQHPRFGKDAEQCFYKAIEIDPWNPEYHVNLGKFYMEQGLSSRAINQCEEALTLSPNFPAAETLLSEIGTRK